MSADIINLRQAKKSRARLEKEQKAQQNRLLFGRSKAEKQITRLTLEKQEAQLDAHRRETGSDTDTTQDDKAQ
jgi:hypothetical protein